MPNEDLKIEPPKDPHIFEGKDAKMAWDREFREMLRANPGIIKTAITLINKAISEYSPQNISLASGGIELMYDKKSSEWLEKTMSGWIPMSLGRCTILSPDKTFFDEQSNLEVVVLGRSNRKLYSMARVRFDISDYLKIRKDEQSFFVKRSFITTNPGFIEFKNTIKAKEVLKDLNFVSVVNAKLGYQDKKESWYVSKWEELESCGFGTFDRYIGWNDYGEKKEDTRTDFNSPDYLVQGQEWERLEEQARLIREKLQPFGINRDLDSNLFYNPKNKKFFLLDVTGRNNEGVGNPVRDL